MERKAIEAWIPLVCCCMLFHAVLSGLVKFCGCMYYFSKLELEYMNDLLTFYFQINKKEPLTKEFGVQAQPQIASSKVQFRPTTLHSTTQTTAQFSADKATITDSCMWWDARTDADSDDDFSSAASDATYTPSSHASDMEDVSDDEAEAVSANCTANICLTYIDSIRTLFRFCSLCGSPVLPQSFVYRFEGTMLCVQTWCLKGCHYNWQSQPTLSSKKRRSGLGDIELATSTNVCGGTFALLHSVSQCMKLAMFCHTKYDEIQRRFVAPAVFSAWNAQKAVLLQDLRQRATAVRLAGDARSDSPGYSAKYSTYTLMDVDTNYVVCGRVVQLGQESQSSVGMERVGLETCLDELLAHDVSVAVVTGHY